MLEIILSILISIFIILQAYNIVKIFRYKNVNKTMFWIDTLEIVISNIFLIFYKNFLYLSILIIILIILILVKIIFIAIYFYKDVFIKNKNIYLFLSILLTILVIFLFFNKFLDSKYELSRISTSEIQEILTNSSEKVDFVVYIGRPTCTSCEITKPKIEKILKEKKIKAFYYNIDIEKESNEIEMDKLLKELNINFVPSIIVFKDSKPYEIITGNDIDSKFEKLLKGNN